MSRSCSACFSFPARRFFWFSRGQQQAGAASAIATGLGIAAGDSVHTLMATFGLSAVLMTSAWAFSIVKYAGVAYLVVLGIRALFEKSDDLHAAAPRLMSAPRAFRQAVLGRSPQSEDGAVLSGFPAAVRSPDSWLDRLCEFMVLGLIFVVMSAGFTSLIALAAGQVRRMARRATDGSADCRAALIGTIYLALGARLAFQER